MLRVSSDTSSTFRPNLRRTDDTLSASRFEARKVLLRLLETVPIALTSGSFGPRSVMVILTGEVALASRSLTAPLARDRVLPRTSTGVCFAPGFAVAAFLRTEADFFDGDAFFAARVFERVLLRDAIASPSLDTPQGCRLSFMHKHCQFFMRCVPCPGEVCRAGPLLEKGIQQTNVLCRRAHLLCLHGLHGRRVAVRQNGGP